MIVISAPTRIIPNSTSEGIRILSLSIRYIYLAALALVYDY
jgi:hypothetical protein